MIKGNTITSAFRSLIGRPPASLHEALGEQIGPTMAKRDSAAGFDQSRRSLLLCGDAMAVTMGLPTSASSQQ